MSTFLGLSLRPLHVRAPGPQGGFRSTLFLRGKETGDEITTLDSNPAEQDASDAVAFLPDTTESPWAEPTHGRRSGHGALLRRCMGSRSCA
ncbi:hypothetical protein [Streptomyces sp. TP-A0356]|uniref:hypothetical protein n=1 Tax=Streptomyces sp. TP-A0356 TaxID=1359208 RepID=UPI0006E3FE52|nr:hypothetical protein [Streptomyces sp. TP-A0356]